MPAAATAATKSGPGLLGLIIMCMLGLFVLGALVVATLNAADLGWPAFIMLTGVGIAGVFCLSTLFVTRRQNRALMRDVNSRLDTARSANTKRGTSTPSTAFFGAFEHASDPALLVKDGKPFQANAAYRIWARDMGVSGMSDAPPPLERLLTSGENQAASIIFRLHRTLSESSPDHAERVSEYVDSIGPEGQLYRYRLTVSRFDGAHLWQISDVTETAGTVKQTLIDAPVGLLSISEDGRVIATNSVLDRWLGVSDQNRPEHLSALVRDPSALLESEKTPGRIVRADARLITRKGIVTPVIMMAVWQAMDTGVLIANIAFYGYSTLGAPNAALAANARTGDGGGNSHESFLASPFAILELEGWELSGAVIKNANPAFETMSDGLVWDGVKFSDIFDADLPLEKLSENPHAPVDAILLGIEKRPVSVYISSDPVDTDKRWAYLVDISARKSLEDQLIQSQKMQAIGQLAAGVAHDFNNLLTTMRLNADELLGRHPTGDPSYQELNSINTTISRAASLVKKLLAFSSKQTLRMELIILSDLLSELKAHLEQSLGERVTLDLVHGRDLPLIRGDTSQMDTVLVNLCVNARDAMTPMGGGRITITTSVVGRDAVGQDRIAPISGDKFVRIAFADTGTGMTDAVKAKIFEPFFTTKEQGKGTGLGLATVYGIVEQMDGHMTVDSELGVGTTFNLYFPVAEAETEADAAHLKLLKAGKPIQKPRDLTGQGTILFVEDEVSVRQIAAKTLRKRGYKVVEAGDGEEAYEILEETETPFDLMISDVVMPGMDGPTLLKKGRALLGDARIVFISGYAKHDFSDLLSEEPDVTFLPKPFTLSELAERVKAEIGESGS